MPIIYTSVARQKVVLCEYSATSSPANSNVRRILAELPPGEHRKSYSAPGMVIHFETDAQGLTVFVVSSDADDSGMRISWMCLADIKGQFLGVCGATWRTAGELSLNGTFARTLKDRMEYFSSPGADRVRETRKQVEDIQQLMKNNIEKVIDRGDRIDHLLNRTNDLEMQSSEFHSSATQLRRQMWWENKKYWLICALITLVIIGVIVLVVVLVAK